MKKLNILVMALVGIAAFTSCATDRDSNPTLVVPTSQAIELLTPEIGENIINLENSESILFKAKQAPNYGFPTELSYWIQISEDNTFSDPDKIASTDTKGKSISYDAPANEIDLGIMKLRNIEAEEDVADWNETITLYARMVACPTNANDSANYVYSNPQPIKVTAYFLKEALPEIWYLTGDCVGYGNWSNTASAIGKGMVPMYVKAGEEYNRFTGKGTVEYIGYFAHVQYGFKVIAPKGLDNWMYSISGGDITDGSGYKSRNNGDDPGNIAVEDGEEGYYRLTLNTADEELKIDAYEPDEDPTVYESMTIGEEDMAPMTTIDGAPNHDWFASITLAAPASVKFAAGNGTEWGAPNFPYGIATTDNDSKIEVAAGTYVVYFNDITGAFMFTEVEE